MPKSPEEVIDEFGGPSTLNVQFVRMTREADDKGEKIDEKAIISQLAKQIGVKPIHVENALQKFWGKTPKAIAGCSF
jgi:methylphosphotriester-DNA--protein-cysteine methyltransferase